MPNETTGASGAQAASNAQPPEGASQVPATDASQALAADADNASSTVDVAALQRELSDAKREAQRLRGERQKAIDAAKAAEDAKLPEQERTQRRLAELEQANAAHERERVEWQTQAAVTKAALKLGFQDPVDAYALLDRTTLEHDESGAPKNVDRLLSDLLKAKPYLGGAGRPSGSADGGVNGQPTTGMDMNARIRAAAGRT